MTVGKRHIPVLLILFVASFLSAAPVQGDSVFASILVRSVGLLQEHGVKLWDPVPVVTDAVSAPALIENGETNLNIQGSLDTDRLIAISQALMKCEDKNQLVRLDLSGTTGLTMIHRNAFREEPKLGSIILPEGVVTIERDAFLYAYHLLEARLPSSLIDANGNIFNETFLAKIILPANTNWSGFRFVSSKTDCIIVLDEGRTSAEINGFALPSVRTGAVLPESEIHRIFVLPSTLSEISVVDLDCGALVSEIYSYAEIPPSYAGGKVMAFPNARVIYVPEKSVKAYKKAWKGMTNAQFKALPSEYLSIDAWTSLRDGELIQ